MRAAVFQGIRQIEMQELPIPQPRDVEVLIKVTGCGVCGTDAHIFSGALKVARPPVVLGHEITGVIEAVGTCVTRFKVGQSVSVDPVLACGVCEFCHIGRPNLCPAPTIIGYINNGGFAQYTLVPQTQVYPIAPAVGPKGGILVETLACVLNGFDRLELKAGKSVMILGAGTVGCLWNQIIRHTPTIHLLQTEIVPFRQQIAKELGAEVVINPHHQNLADAVYAVCPEGVDYIIDASGDPQAIETAIPLVRKGGTLLIFGVCPDQARIQIAPYQIYQKEMKIIASKMPPQTLDRSVRLIEAGLIDVDRIVNRTLALSATATAFDMFEKAKHEVVKMMIDPWAE
ncbi:alcohol dehydrogenase catalytic domain-containing protein [candidate division KSB1 bacterium]|nr:alcohol dehydrogenase catalytic domain-containing protein [candidate division KSB1 bacterium]